MEQMEALKQSIREKEKMVVAFSGGVDSTFLLKVAHDVLGDGAVAVTARSCSFPERELREAKAFCEKEHIKHIVVESEELQIEGFSHNPTNRCYLKGRRSFSQRSGILQRSTTSPTWRRRPIWTTTAITAGTDGGCRAFRA